MTGREQVATTSRPHREKVEYKQQDQVQGNVGDVFTYTPTSHHAGTVSYTHLRAHETVLDLVCRLLLEKKKNTIQKVLRTHETK